MHPGRYLRRRWLLAGLIGAAAALGLIARAWWRLDPWPARLVLDPEGDGDHWGYTPDGRAFLTANRDGVTAWDPITGRRGVTIPPAAPVNSRTKSADGRRFAGWLGKDGAGSAIIGVGDAATGVIERRLTLGPADRARLAFRDGDRTLEVVLSDNSGPHEIVTLDLATGAESRRTVHWPGPRHRDPSAIAPDGRVWAYTDEASEGLQLWDTVLDRPLGKVLKTPTTTRNFWDYERVGATFTPDGRTLIAGQADGRLEFWDVAAGRLLKVVRVHPGGYTPMSLALSPDGRTLVSSGWMLRTPSRFDREWNEWYAWATDEEYLRATQELAALDLATDRVIARARRAYAAGFSPDGRTVVTWAHDRTYSFRDLPGR